MPVFTATYKNMKKFVSEILKLSRSGKPDAEQTSHIEGCVKTNIKDKYNLNTKTSPLYYDNILLPLTNNFQKK